MGFLSATAKYLLFLLNFLIVICGSALIVLGIIGEVNEPDGVDRVTYISLNGFAIGVGVIIFLIAFLGCYGVITANACMLNTYFIILVIMLILQLVLGTLAFISIKNSSGELDQKIYDSLEHIFIKYFNNTKDTDALNEVENVQRALKCCGLDGAINFLVNFKWVPDSCCSGNSGCTFRNLYKGCVKVYSDAISTTLKIIGGISIGFAIIELIAAILACIVKLRSSGPSYPLRTVGTVPRVVKKYEGTVGTVPRIVNKYEGLRTNMQF